MLRANEEVVCPNCGNFVYQLDDVTGFCFKCSGRKQHNGMYILTREHEAQVQELRRQGFTRRGALAHIRQLRRPKCMSCNQPIMGGQDGRSIFCRRTKQCRTAANKFAYLRHAKHMTREQAIEEIKGWLLDSAVHGTE